MVIATARLHVENNIKRGRCVLWHH